VVPLMTVTGPAVIPAMAPSVVSKRQTNRMLT
jgi:hypothetical protein